MRGRWQPKGWFTSLSGSRARNCSKMGSMKYDWMGGTGIRSFPSGSLDNSPDERAFRARPANRHAAPIGGSSKKKWQHRMEELQSAIEAAGFCLMGDVKRRY